MTHATRIPVKMRRAQDNSPGKRALLVSPPCVQTMWSLEHANQFINAPVNIPPLGLLTVAAMLPPRWELRYVDMNATELADDDLAWADLVFISAMTLQAEATDQVALRAKQAGAVVVGGGPYYSHLKDAAPHVDHCICGEAEETLPHLLEDLDRGDAQRVYEAVDFPSLDSTPVPRWDLVDPGSYAVMPVQAARGCPHGCEFCDIMFLNGRKPRHKRVDQVLAELDAIRRMQWRKPVMFVDDNFIGNKSRAKTLLRAVIEWESTHNHRFDFFIAQVSIDLSDDEELMHLMQQAGFKLVFIGVESSAPEALTECGKKQNLSRDMLESLQRIRAHDIEIMAGIIVGFDADSPQVFEQQRRFIEAAAIPIVMASMLIAPPHTPLWRRLEAEGRLCGDTTGNNTLDEQSLNFEPVMGRETLVRGYKTLLAALYAPGAAFNRLRRSLERRGAACLRPRRKPTSADARALGRILWTLGVCSPGRFAFWRLYLYTVRRCPGLLADVLVLACMSHHCNVVVRRFLRGGRRFMGRTRPSP